MVDTRDVIIEYPVTGNGHIAGERYAVKDAATAALVHPNAVIIGYAGQSDLRVNQVAADYLNNKWEALQALQDVNGKFTRDALAPDVAAAVRPVGGRVGIIGDSHAGGAGPGAGIKWFDVFCALTKQRALNTINAGIGGQTAAQILARITDITNATPRPTWCFVIAGFNDIPTASTASSIAGNVIQTIDALRVASVRPIICTIPPCNAWSAAQKKKALEMSSRLRDYATAHGDPVADLYSPLVDASTGGYLATMNVDNNHMSYKGARIVAASLVTALGSLFPANGVPLCGPNVAGADISILINGNFIGDTNSDGVADNVQYGIVGGAATPSLVADGSTGRNWQRVVVTTNPTAMSLTLPLPNSEWSVGDVVDVSLRIRTTNLEANDGRLFVRINQTAATPNVNYLVSNYGYDLDDIVLTKRLTIPTGAVPDGVQFVVGWNGGTGTMDIAQPTVINRTRLGLV